MELLADYGYWGLFLSAFLAATILPLSSEVVLGLLLNHGIDPWSGVVIASVGNVLGAVVNYGLGALGRRAVFLNIFKLSDREMSMAQNRFEKYGIFSLLFAWVPVIGDPLTVVAGLLKIQFSVFVVLVGLGKFLRYAAVAWAVLSM